MAGISHDDTHRFQALLEGLLSQLQASEAALNEAAQPVELDQTRVGRLSRVDAIQMRAMAAEAVRANALRQERALNALRRLEDGTYGQCLTCGGAIDPERLEVDPIASLCIGCARSVSTRRR